MPEGFCSLEWTEFQASVSQSFEVLRQERDLIDVTLVSDDEVQVPAHKLVLSASSEFFKNILRRNTHSHPLLYLSGVTSNILTSILDFMYRGSVQIDYKDITSFMEITDKLKITGLMNTSNFSGNIRADEAKLPQNSNLTLSEYIDYEEEESQAKNENLTEDIKPTVLNLEDPHTNDISKDGKIDDTKEEIIEGSKVRDKVTRFRSNSNKKVLKVDSMTDVESKLDGLILKREGTYHCSVCPYLTHSRGHVREHIETHVLGLSYPCPHCQTVLSSATRLRNHRRKSPICSQGFRKYTKFII